MRKLLIMTMVVVCMSGCGKSSVDTEVIGQIKKLETRTPIVCGDYKQVDLSLGIVTNGTGSMSRDDMTIQVTDKQFEELKRLQAENKLVTITYDTNRFVFCGLEQTATQVKAVEMKQ